MRTMRARWREVVRGAEMGLKSGESGVKAQFRRHVPDAFRNYATLEAVRDDVLVQTATDATDATPPSKRKQTAVFLDGNVLMMAIPEAIATFDEYTDQVFQYVAAAHRAGALVIVVFDEPGHLTMAKREEQERRDAAKRKREVTCSEEFEQRLPPDFSLEALRELSTVHRVKDDRKSRSRFYDAVCREVFDRFAQWKVVREAHEGAGTFGTVVFDGVDLRACDRAVDERRMPFVIGTDEMGDEFERIVPIGEGDMKLMWLDNRLRDLVHDDVRFAKFRLALTCTIDTDSLMTMLLDVAKRRVAPAPGALHSVLCMREAVRRPAGTPYDPVAHAASFLCCDVAMLEAGVQTHLWSRTPRAHDPPTPRAMQAAAGAVCAVAAVCGCDFTVGGLPGARFDHFWEALPAHVATEPASLAQFADVFGACPEAARAATPALRRVCVAASAHMEGKPRYKKQAAQVLTAPHDILTRAVWSVAYWSQQEHEAGRAWGFA